MNIRRALFVLLLVIAGTAFAADWQNVTSGIDYREYREADYDVHVTRIDLTNELLRIIVTRENEKGLKVSEYAKRNHAIAAINGDYFDEQFTPVGLTIGPCGLWTSPKDLPRERVLQVADDEAVVYRRSELGTPSDDGIDAAISGWPAIVAECHALSATELPGSDSFTRSPHPRTALGISRDRHTLYFVVADGRRTGVPGMTLAQLASFMSEKLNACSAINLDGGGSSAMWVADRIVNRPSDGTERRVGDHIAVVFRKDYPGCETPPATPQESPKSTRPITATSMATH